MVTLTRAWYLWYYQQVFRSNTAAAAGPDYIAETESRKLYRKQKTLLMNLIQMKSNKSLIRAASALLALTIVTSGSAAVKFAECPSIEPTANTVNFVGCGVITPTYLDRNSFVGALFQFTDLTAVAGTSYLENKFFTKANMSYTNMSNLSLRESSFGGTNFTGANLQGSMLYGSAFQGADFTNANLTNAKISGLTDFRGANLYGANFTGVTGLKANRLVNVINLAYAIGLVIAP